MMAENAMIQIQERLRTIQNLVGIDLPREHNVAEATISTINKLHERLREDEKRVTPAMKQKLASLYSQAVTESEKEELVIRQALEKIYEIRAIKNERRIQVKHSGNKETIRRGALMKALQTSAATLPLFMSKRGDTIPPPLCGAIPADPNHIAKVGDMVAALQRSPEGDDNWILAEVVSYNAPTGKYDLDDIDEEQKEKITLSRRRVIPLPVMRADPETNPEALFPTNSIVMALYPQTTCFYKGVISAPPITHNDEYEVLFEDSSYSEGYSPPLKVAQRYVIPHRDKKSNKYV